MPITGGNRQDYIAEVDAWLARRVKDYQPGRQDERLMMLVDAATHYLNRVIPDNVVAFAPHVQVTLPTSETLAADLIHFSQGHSGKKFFHPIDAEKIDLRLVADFIEWNQTKSGVRVLPPLLP